jgi:hypothetical protein
LASYTTYNQVLIKDPSALIPPEQSEYNVLVEYFMGTMVAPSFGGTVGATPAPLNYLQIYSPDIQYALLKAAASAQVVEGGGTVAVTAQQLLNLASQSLAQISESPLSVPPAGLSVALAHTGSFNQNQQGATYNVNVSDNAAAAATSGLVTVTETVPAAMTLVSMSGTGWGCSGNICIRGDSLNPGSSYPAITVTVNVAFNAPSPVMNQVSVLGGGSPGAAASDLTSIAVFTCNASGNGTTNVGDVQLVLNQVLGLSPALNDLNRDGAVNVVDAQIVIDAAMGVGCPKA